MGICVRESVCGYMCEGEGEHKHARGRECVGICVNERESV